MYSGKSLTFFAEKKILKVSAYTRKLLMVNLFYFWGAVKHMVVEFIPVMS